MNKENLEAVIKVRRQDGGVASIRCCKWYDRCWYQPIGNDQEVPESWTLIPRGVSTTGAKEHCVVFVADGVEGAEVWVDRATSMPHPDTKAYVVGFLFDPQLERVLCIRKLRPAWQEGKLNGIGGHIEPGETALEAMEREASEEAGLGSHVAWLVFAVMDGFDDAEHPFEVTFFAAKETLMGVPAQFGPFKSLTDEQLEVCWMVDMTTRRQDVVENLPWLVGLAVDFLTDGRPTFTRIEYGAA